MKDGSERANKARRMDSSGITLVEMVVSLALMSLFMMAAVFVVTTGLRLFDRMQSVSRAVMVSNVILDQMAEELEGILASDDDEILDQIQETAEQMQEKSSRPGTNVYLGFKIEQLSCSRPSPEEYPEVFRIDLTLYLERSGMRYETFRYVKLFQNVDDNEILDEDIPEVWK